MQKQPVARFLSRYLPLVIWLSFISFASSGSFSADNTSRIIGPLVHWLFPGTSVERLTLIHFAVRKASHFTEYAILAYLAARAFSTSERPGLQRHWFLAALILIVIYALIDEYHQSFVPSRTASLLDSLVDIAGGLTALVIIRFRKRTADPQQFRTSRV